MLHIYEMHSLLHIETSKREQKAAIIHSLKEENIIDDEEAERLVKKRLNERTFKIDSSGTLRKLFLSDTN